MKTSKLISIVILSAFLANINPANMQNRVSENHGDLSKISSYIPKHKELIAENKNYIGHWKKYSINNNDIYVELYKNNKIYAIKTENFCYLDKDGDDIIDDTCLPLYYDR